MEDEEEVWRIKKRRSRFQDGRNTISWIHKRTGQTPSTKGRGM